MPFVHDHRYFSLHQERSYLLSALATEESRAEHMTRTLETTRVKLQIAEASDDPAGEVGNLRKVAAAITRKLKKCRKSERALANNLAAVTARMQMLEQHQWRKAQFEYSQRMQETPIYGMAQGLQEMTLQPPMCPAYGYPCTPYPPTSYTLSPLSFTFPSMQATPSLQPQSLTGMGHSWNTPLPTPCHQEFQTSFGMSTPLTTPKPGMPAIWQNMDNPQSNYALSNEPIKRGRRMSLPNPPRRTSWHRPGFMIGCGEDHSASENMELGRRLCMVDGTSAPSRMQRMSK